MSFTLTKYVTTPVTKVVSRLVGVVTRYVTMVKEMDSEGNPVMLTEVVTAVTKPIAIAGKRKAYVADIRELYGVVKKVMA